MGSVDQQARLVAATEAARRSPEKDGPWNELEHLAGALQRPEDVRELYLEVLGRELPAAIVSHVGKRALRFHDEWFGADATTELVELCRRILAASPADETALSRITVALTVESRWSELCEVYDRAIAAAPDTARRIELLQEALEVARDFAGDAPRAIGYLRALTELEPSDASLRSALERLLEREGRHGELVELWRELLSHASGADAAALRRRIADTCLARLGDAPGALEQARALAAAGEAESDVRALLERIAAGEGSADSSTRLAAVEAVAALHDAAGRAEEAIEVLRRALGFAPPEACSRLRHALCDRLSRAGQPAEALEHALALLERDPTDGAAFDAACALAAASGAHDRLAAGLAAAAGVAAPPTRDVLRLELASVLAGPLLDAGRAAEVLEAVLSEAADAGHRLAAARALRSAYETAGRASALCDALERLSELEPDTAARKAALTDAARAAERAGDDARAEAMWRRAIAIDGEDLASIDALAALLERTRRFEALVEVLSMRRAVPGARADRRADLVRAARILATELGDTEGAIDAWQRLATEHGEDEEVVAELSLLLGRAGRTKELSELLERASAKRSALLSGALADLGDARRAHGDVPSSVDAYARALLVDPRHERARAGLEAALADAAAGPRAATALAEAYERAGEPLCAVDLIELRLLAAADAGSRQSLLVSAARLVEAELNDSRRALELVARALPLAPYDAAVLREVERLGEATSAWDVVARALEQALAALGPDPDGAARDRAAHLARRLAAVRETLGDLEGALAALSTAASLAPDRAELFAGVSRVAALAGRWPDACRAAVRAAASGHPTPLAHVEAHAAAAGAWDFAAAALENAIDDDDLAPTVARSLELTVMGWHEARRGDLAAAELALRRSFERRAKGDLAPGSREAVAKLAALQRERLSGASTEPAGGWAVALHDTLVLLADLSPGDLEPLYEAASLHGIDAERRARTLERLCDEAGRRWARGEPCEAIAKWAIAEREAQLLSAGDHERLYALYRDAAAWHADPRDASAWLRKAGALANDVLGDPARAEARAREILERDPSDAWALSFLADRYAKAGRVAEHAALLRHELALGPPIARRLELRLTIAHQSGVLGDLGERVRLLADNLDEQPGHEATLEALCRVLEGAGERARLAELLERQAERVEAVGEATRAAALWARAADVAERDLEDPARAARCLERSVQLVAAPAPLDALARLAAARDDHAAAARWLERRLAVSDPSDQPSVALSLARELVAAGHERRAIARLERTLAAFPEAHDARALLAELHRKAEAWAPLAKLLADAGMLARDPATRLSHLRQAAEIYAERLGAPERATEMLERALELAPDDRWIRSTLADAFAGSGRLDEAVALLESLIADFGRRRTPERARLHERLAAVRRAQGRLEEAMAQLEAASSGSAGNASVLAALGAVAAEAGQLDRAEQAYRALLLVVRRQPPGDDDAEVGPSEVLFALSKISARRGQPEPARELADSARVAAQRSSVEARRFVRASMDDDPHGCLEVLAAREAVETDPRERARLFAARASVLESKLGALDDALAARLAAIEADPDAAPLHASARALAHRLGRESAYVDVVLGLCERQRRAEDASRTSTLLMRAGEVLEQDAGDLERAAEVYARVEALGVVVAEAKAALARLAAMRGVSAEQKKRLEEILEMEDAPPELRVDALYRLADVDLASEATRERGIARLEEALAADAQHARAARSLADAVRDATDDATLWSLYERVARASGDPSLLLEYLERRAAHPGVALEEVREAVELAERLGDDARSEALLRRAVARAAELPAGSAAALWALDALAERALKGGDPAGAVAWLREGARRAADRDGWAARAVRAAEIAAGPGKDLRTAAEIYGELLDRDPASPSAWRPLVEVLRKLGDRDALSSLVGSTLGSLPDPSSRNALRLDQARWLLDMGDDEAAIELLRDALVDDPDDHACALLLTETLERRGDREGLAEILSRQLDAARDRGDEAAIAALSLRLADVLTAADRREDAIDVLRSVVELAPGEREPVRVLVAMLGPDDDPHERADLLERLLGFERGRGAARLARDLARLRRELDDDDGVRRALAAGLAGAPDDAELDAMLEAHCRERGLWDELVGVLARRARASLGVGGARAATAAPVLREIARIQRVQLGRPADAAGSLAEALRAAGHDLALVDELVDVAREAGTFDLAIGEIERVLSNGVSSAAEAIRLERELAELRLAAGRLDDAITSLERAFALGGAAEAPRLLEALEAARERASRGGDLAAERRASTRLVDVLLAIGDREGAREALAHWHKADPSDRDALRRLREIDEAAERWDAVAESCRKLIELEHGQDRIDAALRLAEACERAGDPAAARSGLEQALALEPSSDVLRSRLHALYERIGAWRELGASILAQASDTTDAARRHALLLSAGRVLLDRASDPGAALDALREAAELEPADHATTLSLIDALISGGLNDEALRRTEAAITSIGRRRTPELAAYQHRMARIAEAYGDVRRQLEWLTAAMETDRQSGEAAADLAELAMRLDDFDTALKALRVVTMIKNPCRMSRAVAFLRQAQIARRMGDAQKALIFARRARTEDPQLGEAVELLRQLGEG